MVHATRLIHALEVRLAHAGFGLVLELHAVDEEVGQLLRISAVYRVDVQVAHRVERPILQPFRKVQVFTLREDPTVCKRVDAQIRLVDLAYLGRLGELLHHEIANLALVELLLLDLLLSWRSIVVERLGSVWGIALVFGLEVESMGVGRYR